jgi:signal transduction histidine kinase
MLVDDNPNNLQVLTAILKQHGEYRVRAVLNAHMALQASTMQPPDVFLLDIDMPETTGIQLCHQLKQMPELADIPVIFISALDSLDDKIKAFEAGGVDYITKPFQAEEVLARVSSQVNSYRYMQQVREVAAFKERQRIARELHDALNQTLFSTSITAQTLLLEFDERSPTEVKEQVERLHYLTQDALGEMRTLLLELYPKRLRQTPLDQLIESLIRSLGTRFTTPITPHLTEVDVPDDVKLTFYRVAQESFSNAIKHASPNEINVSLKPWRGGAQLIVQDDGSGFQPEADFSGHFGLDNMRTRAADIDATLLIDSAPGEGTLVSLQWTNP